MTGHREVNELQCHTAGEDGRAWSMKACRHTHRVNSRKRKEGAVCVVVHTSGPSSLDYTLGYIARQYLKEQNNKKKTDACLSCLNWNRDGQGVQGVPSLRISGCCWAESTPPSGVWGLPLVSGSLLAPQLLPLPQGSLLPRLGDLIPQFTFLPRTVMGLHVPPLPSLDQQALSQRTKGLGQRRGLGTW